MKYNYTRYGEIVSVDFISGVTRRRESTGRHFNVGFLSGQDHNGNLVLFGIMIMSKELPTYYKIGMDLFYQILGRDHFPKVMCITNSRSLIVAL